MVRHGYDDDDFDIVDADGWNQHDSYAMRRAPQQPSIHMTQQMTTKEAPAYDVRVCCKTCIMLRPLFLCH